MREIHRYQKGTELLLAKAPFKRLVREIAQECSAGETLRFESRTFLALQEVTEAFVARFFTG